MEITDFDKLGSIYYITLQMASKNFHYVWNVDEAALKYQCGRNVDEAALKYQCARNVDETALNYQSGRNVDETALNSKCCLFQAFIFGQKCRWSRP